MHRSRRALALLAAALFAAACSGGTATNTPAPTVAAPVGESPTPAGPTPTPLPTNASSEGTASGAPAEGGDVVRVVLTGGADAGTYTGGDDPNCTVGLVGPQGWGVQWSIGEAGAKQLSSVQLVSAAKGHENDPNSMFQGTAMLLTIGIGPLLSGTSYEIDDKVDNSQDKGAGSVQVQDNGDTAVIHATGTTAEGVGIDATINCPSVTRS